MAARLAGALSFVNIVWGAAIVGVTASAGPALAILSAPLAGALLAVLRQFAEVVKRIALAVQPLWEVLMYATCLYVIGERALQSCRRCQMKSHSGATCQRTSPPSTGEAALLMRQSSRRLARWPQRSRRACRQALCSRG